MPRGKDTRYNKKRIVVRDVNNPNVLWVNFENPSKLHPAVEEYAKDLKRKKSMMEHPSSQPPDQPYNWDGESDKDK